MAPLIHNSKMRRILVSAVYVAAVFLAVACGGNTSMIIRTEVPERPAGQEDMLQYAAPPIDTVRIGFIGLGMRGPGAVERMCQIDGTRVVALCDVEQDRAEAAAGIVTRFGRPDAALYYGSEDVWKQLCDRDDIDLVYIATHWTMHAEIAKYAMEHGKHVAIEVPAAMSLDEIWDLINTSERTRRHCMQLENCVYDSFELTALNMAQHGLFGELLHGEGAYIHNLDEFWDEYWHDWRLLYNRDHRGDVYPTHGLGPVCQVMNIHRGDKMNVLVAMDTKAVNGREYYEEHRGESAPDFQNGDHTMTMIRTEKGKTIMIQHDVVNPRPYNRLYQLTGTKGFANKYPVEGFVVDPAAAGMLSVPDGNGKTGKVDIENLSSHSFVPENVKTALMEKFMHPVQKELEETAKKVGGHGGMDYIMDYRLIYCLRNGLPLDMDVYDLAEWCCLTELTGISIENGNAPVEVPDFTRGGWNKIDGYRHAFVE